MTAQTVYSNDFVVERQRQENAASTPDGPEGRKPILINRIARAGLSKLLIMGLVAQERNDDEVLGLVSAALAENYEVADGTDLTTLVTVRQSRRLPVSKEFVALGGTTQADREKVLQAEREAAIAKEKESSAKKKEPTATKA
jgi:hypothetical protein